MEYNNTKMISQRIEHTLLKMEAKKEDIKRLCEEALEYKFYGICVHPYWVNFAKEIIKNEIKLITVCGFPDGLNLTETKINEARLSIDEGADEIDMVINLGAFKTGYFDYVKREIIRIKEAVGNKILKVIIETPLLNSEEIRIASKIVEESGADFLKTGTGRNGPVKKEDIEIIKNSSTLPIKAAGGIKTMDFAFELISIGVSRIGTSSGVEIVKTN